TVYEGEGVGLLLGMNLLMKERTGTIKEARFGVDNQAAIKATISTKPTPSHYIFDLLRTRQVMVENRHPGIRIKIHWTPGHVGIDGNEEADKLAKQAAEEGSSREATLPDELRKELPRSTSALKQRYNARLK
ncbi:hypothetical protein BD779DRAFT_1390138, partial [Infundibulicybe gibba]